MTAPGLGQSEPPAKASRTAADQVSDLRALLDAAGVSEPFVIGAHSDGATVATLFTQAYPDEVVGLLFVDPRGPRVSARWLDALPAPAADEPASVTDFRDQLETFETDPSLNPEHVHLRTSFAEAAAALDAPGPLFGDRPVVVLSAETTPGPQLGLPPDLAKTNRRFLGRRPAGARGRVDRGLARDGVWRRTRDPGRSAAGGDRRAREDPRRPGDLVAVRHGQPPDRVSLQHPLGSTMRERACGP
jgi:pimeloyl-ACP methyl ester carboxylesterase